jgi:hypothetical protein
VYSTRDNDLESHPKSNLLGVEIIPLRELAMTSTIIIRDAAITPKPSLSHLNIALAEEDSR